MTRYAVAGALMGALALYAALTLHQINLPGLHYDEAFEAVPALQLLRAQPVTAFRESYLTLLGQTWPLMTQDYIGALNTYTTLPFIYSLGPTPTALRWPSILFGAVTLWLTYALTRYLTHQPWAGVAAAFLLAVDPTFIFWNRQGIFVTAVTAAIGLAATFCWLRRLETNRPLWGLAGAFLWGVGLYAKLLFLWLIAAVVGALILLTLPRFFQERERLWQNRPSIKEMVLTVISFLAGCWPLLLYNWQTGGTFLSISQNAQTSYYGVNNLAIGSNLWQRLSQFVTLLNGSHLWYLGDIFPNPLPALGFILILAAILVAGYLWPGAEPAPINDDFLSPRQRALFPFLVIALVIVASIQTVSALWITHFAILMPWPAIAMAAGGWYLLRCGSAAKPPAGGYLSLTVRLGFILLVGSNLFNSLRYHLALSESGGLSAHSDAIYDLSDWLADRPDQAVVAMDWGLAAPVTYLTDGQVTPVEIFGYGWQSDVVLSERLATFVDQPQTLYLWRGPDEIIFDRSQEFKAFYRPQQLEETIEEAFYEQSGRPILGVTRLVGCGTPDARPPEPSDHCQTASPD